MPKAAVLQSAFNAGELSPLMYGSTQSPRYKQGLATALNYIPTLQGPLCRRPGTQYAATVKDSTKPPVLVPFIFSETQAYVLEFGENYIRFYANNGQMVTSGTTYQVFGTYAWGGIFEGSRANLNPGPLETFINTASVSSGSILTVGTQYKYADLQNLRFAQNGDVVYIFNPNYPVMKLTRFGQSLWDFAQVYFKDGPYNLLNSYQTVGDNANVTLTPVNTATPWQSVQTGPMVLISGTAADPLGSGQIQITTSTAHGYQNNADVFITGLAGTVEANNRTTSTYGSHPVSWQITVTSSTTFLLLGSTYVNARTGGGQVYPALFQYDMLAQANATPIPDMGRVIALEISGVRYWGTISIPTGSLYAFPDASQAWVYMGDATGTQVPFPNTTTATSWNLGTYSGQNNNGTFAGMGYPTCGTFHQNRLVMSGSQNSPQQIDGSNTGEYENFSPSDTTTFTKADDNAYSFILQSSSLNSVNWLSSNAQGLLACTPAGEWCCAPSTTSEALTPNNFNTFQTSFYGSSNTECVQAGNAAIYIQRAQRKIREMNFFFQVGTFRSTDLTELSEHITIPTVIRIVYQKENQPLIWGMRSDGNLVSMIYDRTDVSLQAGLTRHQLGGQSDSAGTNPVVVSMAVIPSPDTTFDQLWVVVKRYINSAFVYTVEYMTKVFDDSMLQEDAFQGDCGATYYHPVTITGISIASTCVVTAPAHGYSNGAVVKIVGVDGLNQTTTDVNGNKTITNLVNENTFTVEGVTTNTFQLYNFQNQPVSSVGFSAYVSGGVSAKLSTSISGFTWLEGETVGVLTDGGNHPDVVVSSGGVLTLQYAAAKVQVGYRYPSQGKLLRADSGAADGTSIGKTRRTTRAALMIHKMGDLAIGTSFNNLLNVPELQVQSDNQKADNAVQLYSGLIREGVESAYDFESQICFQQSSMLPGMVQAVVSFMEEQDV